MTHPTPTRFLHVGIMGQGVKKYSERGFFELGNDPAALNLAKWSLVIPSITTERDPPQVRRDPGCKPTHSVPCATTEVDL